MTRHISTLIDNCTATILEHMPVGVALYTPDDLQLVSANPYFQRYLYPYLQPFSQRSSQMNLSDSSLRDTSCADLNAIFLTVAQTGIPYKASEYPVAMEEYGITYWNWTLKPIYDAHNICTHLLQTAYDVTAQVIARQQTEKHHTILRATNARAMHDIKRLEVIETIARSVRESLDMNDIARSALHTISTHFHTTHICIHVADASQQMLRLLSLSIGSTMEQQLTTTHTVPYTLPLPVSQSRTPCIIEDIQRSSEDIKKTVHFSDNETRGYICQPLWFKNYFEGTLTALFSYPISFNGIEAQTLAGCSTHIAAALAHARLYKLIEDERSRVRSILDQLPEGVFIVESSAGSLSYANAAASHITGIHLQKYPGQQPDQPISRLLCSDSNGEAISPEDMPLHRALMGETIIGCETHITRPDGSTIVTLSSAAPIRSLDGTITGAVTVFQDITRQKSIEQHKNEFLSIASHELRTPITAILGFAELLQLKVSPEIMLDSQRDEQAIAGILDQCQRLTRLIEEMLDMAHLDQARILLNPGYHNLIHTVKQVIESQAITAPQCIHLTIETSEPTEVLSGYFDEDRIVQVLNNLLSNAIKYSPPSSTIEVGLQQTSSSPSEALIWVRDTGIGIPSAELPYIFRRFHRASNLDRNISGLGIGLYLVNELITRHGGSVWVESIEGTGSTFYVSLPLNNRETEPSI